MQFVISRSITVRALVSFVFWLTWGPVCSCWAQTNSWTNSVSGNWEDTFWSLGLPVSNQDVSLTNAGWKALAINPATVHNFASTLTLDSVTISSPSNSYNTLLLNFAGFDTPLSVRSMTVASNSAVTMFSSALLLQPYGIGMQVGGEFDQNDSIVSGQQVNVGYIGPGVYNLNSGLFAVSNLWVGSPYSGVFNQNGGTNTSGVTHLEGGEYIFSDGDFASTIYFNGGTFLQRGGILENSLTIYYGTYLFENGIHSGDIEVPSPNGWGGFGHGAVVQSGGTNLGNLTIGIYGIGSYTLSNGLCSGSVLLGEQGSYTQWNGTLILSNDITIDGGPVYEKGGGGSVELGNFSVNGGTVSCPSMWVSGNYDQRNGTNYISGTLSISGEYGHFLSSGLLCVSNLTMDTFYNDVVAKTASFDGTIVVTNELHVVPGPPGFVGSGTLIVSNITLVSGARFYFGGTISQSGIISAAGANISLGEPGIYHFGGLQGGGNFLSLSPTECIVAFADGSKTELSDKLTVTQWSGSLYGGGANRLLFGTNDSGLTPQQLSQIQFQNPAGLAPGTYPARILATGEVVPDTGAPLPPKANLSPSTNGAMHLSIGADISQTYAIEISTDLMHWSTWTNQYNTSGTMDLNDDGATNCPQRFYRARLLP